jgi:hypothetical protein
MGLFTDAELANIAAWNVRDAVFKEAQKNGSSDPTAAGSSAYDKALEYYMPSYNTSTPTPVVTAPPVTNVPTQIPANTGASVTGYPTGYVPQGTQQVMSARDQRQQAMNLNGWSNDSSIAILEQKAWSIYVETGRWDTPEQKQYHDQAEAIRKSLNPLIPRTNDGSGEQGMILPTDQFPTTNGMDTKGLITLGAGGLFLVIIMSMFKR